MKSLGFSALVFAAFATLTSCSLKYTEDARNVEDSVPEFVFDNVDFSRYEKNKRTIIMRTETLEQYRGGASYASGVQFETRDDEGEVEIEGSCDIFASDESEGRYSLYGSIELANHTEDVAISADELRWNERSEQLTSGRNGTVKMTKGDTTIIGSGFSASGVSKNFAFTGAVEGFVETEDAADEGADETE